MDFKITRDEFDKFKKIGSGAFGAIYTDFRIVIKKYNSHVKAHFGGPYENPCLENTIGNRLKFIRLNHRNKKLKYSDTALEKVYLGREFIGVKKLYYSGETFSKLMHAPLSLRKKLSKDLSRNAKELTDHRIYNLDYKLNNVMFSLDGEVKIIDLDDYYTKATLLPNPLYKRKSIRTLRDSLTCFLYKSSNDFPMRVIERIENNPYKEDVYEGELTYSSIDKFINSVDTSKRIIMMDIDKIPHINLPALKKYMELNNLKLILAIDNRDKIYPYNDICDTIDYINSYDIAINDLLKIKKDFYEEIKQYYKEQECECMKVYHQKTKVLEKNNG